MNQKYKHNLRIRKTLETIITTYNVIKNPMTTINLLRMQSFLFCKWNISITQAQKFFLIFFRLFKTLIIGSDATKIHLTE